MKSLRVLVVIVLALAAFAGDRAAVVMTQRSMAALRPPSRPTVLLSFLTPALPLSAIPPPPPPPPPMPSDPLGGMP